MPLAGDRAWGCVSFQQAILLPRKQPRDGNQQLPHGLSSQGLHSQAGGYTRLLWPKNQGLLSTMLVAPLCSSVTVPRGKGTPSPLLEEQQLQSGHCPLSLLPGGVTNPSKGSWPQGPGHPTCPSCCPHDLKHCPHSWRCSNSGSATSGADFPREATFDSGMQKLPRETPQEHREQPKG